MKRNWVLWYVAMGLFSASASVAAEPVVRKIADDFGASLWTPSQYSRATATQTFSTQKAPDARTTGSQSWNVHFGDSDFEWCGMEPATPLWIPGSAKSVTLRAKLSDDRVGLKLTFVDGWGRDKVNGKPLELDLKPKPGGAWQTLTAKIPEQWVKPIRLAGITTHNWNLRGRQSNVTITVDDLEIETDISLVDPKTGRLGGWRPDPEAGDKPKAGEPITPLVSAGLSPGQLHNVFAGSAPVFSLNVRSWLAQPVTGELRWKLADSDGALVKEGTEPVRVEDAQSVPLRLDPPRYGLYRLEASAALSDGTQLRVAQPLAYLPKPVELTEQEKDASPYGLNVMAARKPMVSTFRSAGIIWYRDYGFDYSFMTRAKGKDRSYAGWPSYPPMVKMYQDNGVRILACMKTAIKPPRPDGTIGPDAQWRREVADIVMAFPYIRHYELDNEYDLNSKGNSRAEVAGDWANYREYHRVFGEIVDLMGAGNDVAVENGRAGIFPERVKACVASGAFQHIQVVNSHHYTGTDAPEVNVEEHNVGIENGEATLTFFDQLRGVKRAAAADGHPRQHWLTEFGWDTKAGPIVTPFQQAAYLSRGYMLAMAAGCEKAFWFFDVDGPKAVHFFDGCGLMTSDQLPNLSLCAMAGLTQILPRPQFVGMISAGDDTRGYLFRNDGKLVATLFTLTKEKGPAVDFGRAALYDYLANPLQSGNVVLTPAPVFAVGVSEDSRWFRQSAYMLQSPYLVTACAGDEVTAELQVRNERKTTIQGTLSLDAPKGWSVAGELPVIHVEAGKTVVFPVRFRVDPQEKLGEETLYLAISEGEPLLRIPLRVQTREPIGMIVRGLQGRPGESNVVVQLVNRSATALDGTLQLQLPASWKTAQSDIPVNALQPAERREIACKVTWSADWKESESAWARYRTSDGRLSEQPLIPSQLSIHKVAGLTMDGDLGDWPAGSRVPEWVLGCTHGKPNTQLYLAWSDRGLYVGARVAGSKASSPDPRAFWGGDCLELFVDTRDKKVARKFEPGDHQFWLVPQADQKRVYVGQWKRGTEIAATRYDLPGVESSVVRTPDGYTMECLIPAAQFQGLKLTPGQRLGASLNLTVKGPAGDREVFWILPKADGSADHPEGWGSVILAD